MSDVDASKVISRLAQKVAELVAQVALLETALEQATGDTVVEE